VKFFGTQFLVQTGISVLLAVSIVVAMGGWPSAKASEEPIHCVGYSRHICALPFPAVYARSPAAYGDLPIAVVGCVFTDGEGRYFIAPDPQIANRRMPDYAVRLVFDDGSMSASVSNKVGHCISAWGRLRRPPEGSVWWADLALIRDASLDVGPDSPFGGDARGLPPPPAPPRPTE